LGAVVTTAAEVTEATPFVSVLYIPGDLSRQADLLNACVDSGCEIWVERGAFLGVADMNHIAEKLSGARGGIVETGSAFGYGDRLLDPRAFAFARQLNLPIMLNISHVAQPPGAPYPWATGWQRNLTVELFLECGIAMGATGFVCDAALHPDLAHGGLLATQARALQSLRGRIGETHRHE
jgi:2-dehydro-3-deoxyphosphooctonate aldolase (KDO 8-P synthase)